MMHDHDPTLDLSAPKPGSSEPQALDEERLARLAVYGGVTLVGVGFLILYLGYNGAATHTRDIEQIPYMVSGGFGGIALMLLGSVMVMSNALLKGQAMLRRELGALRESMHELSTAIVRGAPATSANGTAAKASTNGHVVAMRGGSSFHKPQCRLVANRTGLLELELAIADEKGLMPCRVCKPA